MSDEKRSVTYFGLQLDLERLRRRPDNDKLWDKVEDDLAYLKDQIDAERTARLRDIIKRNSPASSSRPSSDISANLDLARRREERARLARIESQQQQIIQHQQMVQGQRTLGALWDFLT